MNGYNEIKTEQDIKDLMKIFYGFHDSCIAAAEYKSGDFVDDEGAMCFSEYNAHRLKLTMHSQWAEPLELLFCGVRKFSVVSRMDNYTNELMDASLGFYTELLGKCRNDRLIVWADGNFNPLCYTEETLLPRAAEHHTYVVAEQLFWRFVQE